MMMMMHFKKWLIISSHPKDSHLNLQLKITKIKQSGQNVSQSGCPELPYHSDFQPEVRDYGRGTPTPL